MQKVITVREDQEMIAKIEKLAKLRLETKSEIIRDAIRDYVQRKLELIEIQKLVAKRYTEGKLSFDELVKLLGYEEAKKIGFYKDLAEESFVEGLK